MADLAPNNPTGRTVGQATTAFPPPSSGGGGLPDLAFLLAEYDALFRTSARSRQHGAAILKRMSELDTLITAVANENGMCGQCLEDLAGRAGPYCSTCEVPF